jgi:hypothetical protein
VECEAYSTGVSISAFQLFQKVLHRPLNSLPFEPVSHNPLAQKQVWFRKGDLPPFTQIARATLLTYLPPLHRKFARARVFKASDLDHLFHPLGLQRTATDYIWPTFEHGGNFLQPILKPLFGAMRKMENAPMPLKMFGTSLVSGFLKTEWHKPQIKTLNHYNGITL